MLELMDGKRTLRQVAELAASKHNTPFDKAAPTLLAYLRHLIDQVGVATTDVTQCHDCPARRERGSESA